MAEMKQKHHGKITTLSGIASFLVLGIKEMLEGSCSMSSLGIARVYTVFYSKERPFRIPGEQNGFSCLLEKALL